MDKFLVQLLIMMFGISLWIIVIAAIVQFNCKMCIKRVEKFKIKSTLKYNFKISLISSAISVLIIILLPVLFYFCNYEFLKNNFKYLQKYLLVSQPCILLIVFKIISRNSWLNSVAAVWGLICLEFFITLINLIL